MWDADTDAAADAGKKAQGEGKKLLLPHRQHQNAPAHVEPVMSSLRTG
jgi:hypothetical protein